MPRVDFIAAMFDGRVLLAMGIYAVLAVRPKPR